MAALVNHLIERCLGREAGTGELPGASSWTSAVSHNWEAKNFLFWTVLEVVALEACLGSKFSRALLNEAITDSPAT